MLCSNRFPLPGSPSTCALDTAIVPLPSFLFLVALAAHFGLRRRNSSHEREERLNTKKWVHIAYLVLVVAQICMTILELIRLGLENLGLGLLPVNTIALICAFVVLLRERVPGRSRRLLQILIIYWLLEFIFEAVKSARLHTLEELNPTTSDNSKYPSSDWFLDNAVMLALYLVFCVGELATLLFSSRHRLDAQEAYKLQSPV
ncbi:hypothetical protein C8F01DRAFT_652829 [Mycena amicta]|nr:hypothetical protein C8F01DRAFT_652829 [Mycena amicta]